MVYVYADKSLTFLQADFVISYHVHVLILISVLGLFHNRMSHRYIPVGLVPVSTAKFQKPSDQIFERHAETQISAFNLKMFCLPQIKDEKNRKEIYDLLRHARNDLTIDEMLAV